jgi:hypothetical protein
MPWPHSVFNDIFNIFSIASAAIEKLFPANHRCSEMMIACCQMWKVSYQLTHYHSSYGSFLSYFDLVHFNQKHSPASPASQPSETFWMGIAPAPSTVTFMKEKHGSW